MRRLINPYANPGSEHCLIRRRYLYVLLFKGEDTCYVGQTVCPPRRRREHRLAWHGKRFTMYVVGHVKGTYSQAEDAEYAWRAKAQEQDLKIYGSPQGYFVDSSHRLTPARLAALARLRWPAKLTPQASGLGWSLWRLLSRVH